MAGAEVVHPEICVPRRLPRGNCEDVSQTAVPDGGIFTFGATAYMGRLVSTQG